MKKILKEIREKYAKERSYKSFQHMEGSVLFTSKDFEEIAIRFATHVAHNIVNDAICSPDYIKQRGSNHCAEFVNNWVESNLPKH